MNDNSKPINGNIEAIIVDGVRYDKVKAKTKFVCEECELARKCGIKNSLKIACYNLTDYNECWKRKEEGNETLDSKKS